MTSFVTTATTMFNRFPLRHSKKEPAIGFPVLDHSTRKDMKDSEKNLPPLPPNESYHDFNAAPVRSPTRYTTTPNFDVHPILPSQTSPPPFLQAIRLASRGENKENFVYRDLKEPVAKKSGFRRKEVPVRNTSPVQQHQPQPQPQQKNIDVLEAVNSAYHSPTYSSYPKSIEEDKKITISPDPMPSTKLIGEYEARRMDREVDTVAPIPQMKASSKPDRPPRLRDSIIPTINPIDKSFLGDFLDDDEDDPSFEVQPLVEDRPIVSSMAAAELFGPNIRVKGDEAGSFPGPDKPAQQQRKARTDIPFLDIALPPTPNLDFDSPSFSSFRSPKLAPVLEATPPPTPPTPEEHIEQLEARRDHLTSEQRRIGKEISNLQGLLHRIRLRTAIANEKP